MKRLRRSVLTVCGLLCVALGTIGIFLPVLPTVPFLLLALWCFARSSERFYHGLYHHHLFGPMVQQWEKHKIIPRRAKIIAIGSMFLSASYVIFYTKVSVYLVAAMLAIMAYGAYFILSKPSHTGDR